VASPLHAVVAMPDGEEIMSLPIAAPSPLKGGGD